MRFILFILLLLPFSFTFAGTDSGGSGIISLQNVMMNHGFTEWENRPDVADIVFKHQTNDDIIVFDVHSEFGVETVSEPLENLEDDTPALLEAIEESDYLGKEAVEI